MHEMLLRVWTSVSFPVLPSLHSLPFCLLKVETVPSRVCSSETKRNEDGFFSIKQKKGFEKTLSNFSLPSKKTFDSKSNLWLFDTFDLSSMNYLELLRKIASLPPFSFFLQKVFLKQFWMKEGSRCGSLQLRHSVFLLANARKSRKERKRKGERGEGTRIFVLTFWSRWEGG